MRLTLDIDEDINADELYVRVLTRAFNRGHFHKLQGKPYEIRESSNGGKHLVIYNVDLGAYEVMALREELGDDPVRLDKDYMNLERGLPVNILFNKKIEEGEVKEAKLIEEGKI